MDPFVIIICTLLFVVLLMVGALSLLVYNQCLLFNEVNKRLLFLVSESAQSNLDTIDNLQQRVEDLTFEAEKLFENARDGKENPHLLDEEEPFDPHSFILKDEEGIS